MTADQDEVTAFLSDPASHAGAGRVDRIGTHGNLVFLAGGEAWKIKRAVRFAYMDFSTLEKRRAACEREVEVNRRLAPEIYLGCVPIVRKPDGRLAFGAGGEVVEWAVRMRRFDQTALLSHAAVMAQAEILDELVVGPDGPRRSVGWAPFFHDLGLFLNLLPPGVWGQTTHQLPTERFARDPAEWLRIAERCRAALTLAPSSGFGSALRSLRRSGERVDLNALEVARFAAEGVDPNVLDRVCAEAPRLGLRLEALGSTYGMAEVVLAVCYSSPGSGLQREAIDIDALATEGVAMPAGGGPARTLVGCGAPKLDLRIAGPAGALPERSVGEIQLRGPSLMSGYVGEDVDDPIAGGWLRTGDLGYVADGQLFPTGRTKDMVIVTGHNYYPEDFEWAAGRVSGVRAGRCVAFAEPQTEHVVVLVEPAGESEDPSRLRREVERAIADSVGILPREVLVLPPGTVEKTTSGKLRRAAMREAYLRRELVSAPFSARANRRTRK